MQPGSDADLDSLIQDTVRLTASGKVQRAPVICMHTRERTFEIALLRADLWYRTPALNHVRSLQ